MPGNQGSAEGKTLRFRFQVDEQSAQRVLDIFKSITEAARVAQQASGGVFGQLMGSVGGIPGGGAFPGMPAAPQGPGAAPSRGSLAQVVLENVNAFRKIQGVGEQAMRGLTDVLRRAVGEQRRELEGLDRTLASLTRKYEDLNQKAAGAKSATMAQRYDAQAQGVVGEMADVQLQRAKLQADLRRMTGGGDEAGGGGGSGGGSGGIFGGGIRSVLNFVRGAGLFNVIRGGMTGIMEQPLLMERTDRANAVARASLTASLYQDAIRGDFTTMAMLGRRSVTDPSMTNLERNAYAAGISAPGRATANFLGKLGLASQMPGVVGGATGMVMGGSGPGAALAEIFTGGLSARQAQEFLSATQQNKQAEPGFVAAMEDAQARASQRFRFRNLMGGLVGSDRMQFANLMRKGAHFGLGEGETQELAMQMRQVAGGAAQDLLPTAAGAESQFGVNRGVAAQVLGAMGLAGGPEKAKQFWNDIMGKAFVVGIRDSRMSEVIAGAVGSAALSDRGRLPSTATADLLTGGLRPGADLFDISMRQKGLESLNRFETMGPGSPLGNLRRAQASLAFRGMRAGFEESGILTRLTADQRKAVMQWHRGMPVPGDEVQSMVTMMQAEKGFSGLESAMGFIQQQVGSEMMSGTAAALDPDLRKRFEKSGFSGLSAADQERVAYRFSYATGGQFGATTPAMAKEMLRLRENMQGFGGGEFVGPMQSPVPGGDVDPLLAKGAAEAGLAPLMRQLQDDFPKSVQFAVTAQKGFIDGLRNSAKELMDLNDPARVIRDAAGALRDLTEAASQLTATVHPGYTGAPQPAFGKQGG